MQHEIATPQDGALIGAALNTGLMEGFRAPAFNYDVQCFGPDESSREDYLRLLARSTAARLAGDPSRALAFKLEADSLVREQWRDAFHNLVTTAGKTDIVDKYLKGSAYTAAWYMLLKGSGTAATSDTLASHSGWTEVSAYSGNRPSITWGSTSGGSNTASAVSFTMNAGYTVAGCGICTAASGTSGTLYSAGDFGTPRSGGSGDTLNVTITESIS